jgi:hypothetical protein
MRGNSFDGSFMGVRTRRLRDLYVPGERTLEYFFFSFSFFFHNFFLLSPRLRY